MLLVFFGFEVFSLFIGSTDGRTSTTFCSVVSEPSEFSNPLVFTPAGVKPSAALFEGLGDKASADRNVGFLDINCWYTVLSIVQGWLPWSWCYAVEQRAAIVWA